jgi:hypothetical protein
MPDDTNMVGSCLADINGDDQLDVLVANYDWSSPRRWSITPLAGL